MPLKSLLWLSISASLDLNRWEDRQNLLSSNPISVQEAEAYFQNNSLTPYQQERFRYSMEQTASVSYIESVLDSKGSRNSRPISMRIAALKALDAKSSPDSLAALWEIYVRSRFRDLQEDPDLFERALRTIIKIESLHPNSNRPHIEKTLPQLVKAYVESTQSESVASYLQACYEQHRIECIRAFQSHRGSLLLSFLESPPVSISPLPLPQPPGQWEDEAPPQKSNVEIRTLSPSLSIPKSLVVGVLTLALVILSRRHRWQKYAAVGLGLTVFLWIEVFLEWIEHPTLAEQQPLFSFIDWKYEPYQSIRRDSDEWWVSEGGPARWQEVRASRETFTIATLGASSAHGSNLLQEETFSALLASRLQRENPSQSLQILNFGIGGTTSNGVLYSGKQALSMGADALVIYYGHNEVPQFHQLSTFEGTSYLSLRLLFSHIRLYEILHRFLPSSSSSSPQPISLSRQRIQELAITNHRYNIAQLLQSAQAANIPVLMVKPAYNFRFAPYNAASKEQNTKANVLLEEAKALRPTDPDASIRVAHTCLTFANRGSDTALEAYRMLAELYAQRGKPQKAREHFQALFDEAAETTTIHSGIAQNIIELAQAYGTSYLDVEELFYAGSADGITANTLFWDELHPSFEGHRRIAEAIYPWANQLIPHD